MTNKAFGTVYRIDEPEKFGVNLSLAGFFAKKPVFGKCAEDGFANRLLAFDIGLSHRRHVGLDRYRKIAREIVAANSGRLIGRR